MKDFINPANNPDWYSALCPSDHALQRFDERQIELIWAKLVVRFARPIAHLEQIKRKRGEFVQELRYKYQLLGDEPLFRMENPTRFFPYGVYLEDLIGLVVIVSSDSKRIITVF
jgi:hypothetical protein